ncbi:hypothetical protein [Clostridium sp. BJN0013]|uniref:hypothetical protein n=1 Tax=Clostridium sp. BJN0013 TaxID=3236840 RepID=UPI0034C69A98
MFCNRKGKVKKGFILVYVLFVGCICILISLGCYSMEMYIRSNGVERYKQIFKVNAAEKYKEYLLTELNQYICDTILCETTNVKEYMNSLDNFKIYFEESYIYYDGNIDCFIIKYIINGDFYKQEIFEYEIKGKDVAFSCVDYSFVEGD